MNRTTSIYLDAVRLSAALLVVLTHLAYPRFSGGLLLPLRTFGNDAVMVFFVLSGYVIAYTAATRDRDLGTYALNRCARLYSVALPAVLVTWGLDQIGQWLDPALYEGFWYQASDPWQRVLAALTFTNEMWFQSLRLFTNGPYWSLGYEFWYYALFAAGWYFRGWRRWALTIVIGAFIGPKILLLLPVWLLGVWVYRVNTQRPLGAAWGALLWLGSIALYVAFRASGMREALLDFSYLQFGRHFVEAELRWSNEFLSSYFIGPLVAANFIGFHAFSHHCAPLLARVGPLVRDWAGYTFSIYLFHYPVMQFFGALLPLDPRSPVAITCLFVITVSACRGLGLVSEKRKDRARDLLLSAVLWSKGIGRKTKLVAAAPDKP